MISSLPNHYESLTGTLSVTADDISESHEHITIRNIKPNTSDLRNSIDHFCKLITTSGFGKILIEGDVCGALQYPCDISPILNDIVVLKIDKNQKYQSHFLSTSGVYNALDDWKFANSTNTIVVNSNFSSFSSHKSFYVPWDQPNDMLVKGWDGFHDPREFVRDLSGDFLIVSDIRQWLLRTKPQKSSDFFEEWRYFCSEKLLMSLISEISKRPDSRNSYDYVVTIKGTRNLKLEYRKLLKSDITSIDYDHINSAVAWIFDHSRGAEIRHSIFLDSLSIEWPKDKLWPLGMIECIESALKRAKEVYRYHLRNEGREVTKSLLELRKAVHEDSARVTQLAINLRASLWRDFVVSAGFITINVFKDDSKDHAILVKILSTVFLTYLVIGLIVGVVSTLRALDAMSYARGEWKKRLYYFIGDDDFKSLVTNQWTRDREPLYVTGALTVVGYLFMIIFVSCVIWS